MILKLFKTVEQKNVNVFKIKTFKPVQNMINSCWLQNTFQLKFMFLVKIIEQWIVQSILVMQLKAFHITIWLCVRKSFKILRQHFSDFRPIYLENYTKFLLATPSFFWLHQDSFGILKAQDQIYFISIGIGIGQEKLDPNHQKMTKRVNEDLYEYH